MSTRVLGALLGLVQEVVAGFDERSMPIASLKTAAAALRSVERAAFHLRRRALRELVRREDSPPSVGAPSSP